jgi:hypothetical protein
MRKTVVSFVCEVCGVEANKSVLPVGWAEWECHRACQDEYEDARAVHVCDKCCNKVRETTGR